MIITRYGIKLIKIREEHIEEVRKWRNSPSISGFMEYQEYITVAMQKKWFQSLDELTDFFFVIEYGGKMMGLIHTSAIDWDKKEGHSGLFIWDKKFQSTHIPVLASLSMVDFFFYVCSLETIYAKVKHSNHVAVEYNKKLGFKLNQPADNREFQEYKLEKKDYLESTEKLHLLAEEVEHSLYEIRMRKPLYELLESAGALVRKDNEAQEALIING